MLNEMKNNVKEKNKGKIFEDPTSFSRMVGAIAGVTLIVIEVLICMQYARLNHELWMFVVLSVCMVILDGLCAAEFFVVKRFSRHVAVYVADFVLLLVICTFSGSAYLSALYCVILTQLYITVDDFKAKSVAFGVSCVMFVATNFLGLIINYAPRISYDNLVSVISGCVAGLIVLAVHFAVVNVLITLYRTNAKLREALKEAEDSKVKLEEAYKQLSETAVFEERNRIARDIHDNAGHSMTAVIMQTEAAKLLIDTNPEDAKVKIIAANIQAKNALEQMRDSVHLLAGRGESRTIKEEIEEIIAQTIDGTDVKIRSSVADISLPYDRRRFINNSLKECLSNGIRHGGATAFYVEFRGEEDGVVLSVSDNGSGLPEDFKEGFGIRGMREKAAAFGGGIVYESERGEGVEITLKIPVSGKENKA